LPDTDYDESVFINCPFDEEYAPLLEAMMFCVILFGFAPCLASQSRETGAIRFDKIIELARGCRYSIHDLSRCKITGVRLEEAEPEYVRMNMPFELGIDFGLRNSGIKKFETKRFLIFEEDAYDLKRALSDLGGQDPEYHSNDPYALISKVRNFFRVETDCNPEGPAIIYARYETFQGWMVEKKIHEGHTETEAINLPTQERIDEMKAWIDLKMPDDFSPQIS